VHLTIPKVCLGPIKSAPKKRKDPAKREMIAFCNRTDRGEITLTNPEVEGKCFACLVFGQVLLLTKSVKDLPKVRLHFLQIASNQKHVQGSHIWQGQTRRGPHCFRTKPAMALSNATRPLFSAPNIGFGLIFLMSASASGQLHTACSARSSLHTL
jgi:hypothetical protein